MLMAINANITNYFNQKTQAHPLAFFRFSFGLLMFISIIRFWLKGWINKFYIEPDFHFSFYGFSWVKPVGDFTYLLFFICALSALLVAIGYKYRLSIVLFFLSFTYIELMDKTTYLNHYYFVSLVSFMLIFLPGNTIFSADSRINKKIYSELIPKWTIDVIKLMLCIVYFYAGLAKLNSDWLIEAQPMKIWLSAKDGIPIVGNFLTQKITPYFFSYFGAVFDLTIPFLLLLKPTRPFAYILVVVFHIATRILFPIGMFPYLMIISTIIFFDSKLHKKIIKKIESWLKLQSNYSKNHIPEISSFSKIILLIFFIFQLVFPFRYLAYPGELFWTEEGYRFSWRVMLMDKTGYANFKVVNPKDKSSFYINNSDYLTPFQEKQMSFQADFIVQFAHHLEKIYEKKLSANVEVYVESYASLNGRGSQVFISPDVDLTTVQNSCKHKKWILPLNDEIKGI